MKKVSFVFDDSVNLGQVCENLRNFTDFEIAENTANSQPKSIVNNKPLDERIAGIFISMGIPAHIRGYQYLREAVKLCIDSPNYINNITKTLYPTVAKRFNATGCKVERAIRHAIGVAWNRGKFDSLNNLFGIKIYSSNDKPTNGEFIAMLADKLLIEGA